MAINLTADRRNADARILIVDDEAGCVKGLMRILEQDGYSLCIGLTDPRRAVQEFLQIKPDLVLLDWHMEEMGGLEFLSEIQKEDSALTLPPIIVLTGDCCPETRQQALAAGVSDFLIKPVDPTETLLRIRNILRLHRLHLHVQSENRRLEEIVEARTRRLQKTIVELKEVQQQVINEERMRALAMMAGGVAHDFNNVLTIISGYSEMYALEDGGTWSREEARKVFEIISLSARDAGEIVRRLREFYRPFTSKTAERELKDLNSLIMESVDLGRPKWETQTRALGICVTLVTELGKLPELAVVPSEIREVLLNLIFNAVDAMPQGGQITIRSRAERDQAIFEIEDTGTGMTEETRRRCLEPFYTTKGERGTGLGLAIMYSIIRRHDGRLEIHSELNRGTRITISLPAGADPAPDEEETLPVQRHLRILVVDDDPLVCSVMNQYLVADGHSITVANNGCEALEKFHAQAFDIVITDRVMPKMSGDQLAVAIREIAPAEPIILLTGFEMKKASEQVNLVVYKPLTLESLRGAISKVMATTALARSEIDRPDIPGFGVAGGV